MQVFKRSQGKYYTFTRDLIVNSPVWMPHISSQTSYESLVLDQDNLFYLIRLSILITFLLDNVWML